MATSEEILAAMIKAREAIEAVGGVAEWLYEDNPFSLETNLCVNDDDEYCFGETN